MFSPRLTPRWYGSRVQSIHIKLASVTRGARLCTAHDRGIVALNERLDSVASLIVRHLARR
jgi:hypothetical protein